MFDDDAFLSFQRTCKKTWFFWGLAACAAKLYVWKKTFSKR